MFVSIDCLLEAETLLGVFAQPYQVLLAVAAVTALVLIGLTIHRVIRRRSARIASLKSAPSTLQPYLATLDGRVQLPLSNLSTGGCVVGRAPDADVRIEATLPHAETVSAHHARIYRDPASGFVIIEDLNSTGGVLINGRRAGHKNLLKDRWIIAFGDCTLIYRDGNPDTGPLR